jgi:hypothetical protein
VIGVHTHQQIGHAFLQDIMVTELTATVRKVNGKDLNAVIIFEMSVTIVKVTIVLVSTIAPPEMTTAPWSEMIGFKIATTAIGMSQVIIQITTNHETTKAIGMIANKDHPE